MGKKDRYVFDISDKTREYSDMVWRLALLNTDSREDAEDCFQNVFLKLYRHRSKISSEEHLKAWLIRVTVNECHDLYRSSWKNKTDHGIDDDRCVGLPDENPSVEDEVWAGIEAEGIYAAVKSLPASYRDVIHLYYYEEYNVREIARVLGISASAVKTRLMRARAQLKDRLKRDCFDE